MSPELTKDVALSNVDYVWNEASCEWLWQWYVCMLHRLRPPATRWLQNALRYAAVYPQRDSAVISTC